MFPTVNLSGGGGLIYSASVILALSKAQIKEGAVQTGIIVSVKTLKNRFGKPIPIKFHIRWDKGMNRFIGMEEYMSWETCGIQRGNMFPEKDYEKWTDAVKSTSKPFENPKDGKTWYFVPKETARYYIVKHLGEGVTAQELFTERVWNQEVLEQINEKCIKPKFSYGTEIEGDAIDEFLNDNELSSTDAE
jgi:hypothetical protein